MTKMILDTCFTICLTQPTLAPMTTRKTEEKPKQEGRLTFMKKDNRSEHIT